MQNSTYNITLLLLGTTFLILLMAVIIIVIVFLYRKRQMAYLEKINEIKTTNEKELLTTKLEIQEQTFQHISREIHDNISLSLTLVKLHLNTFEWGEEKRWRRKIKQLYRVTQQVHYRTQRYFQKPECGYYHSAGFA